LVAGDEPFLTFAQWTGAKKNARDTTLRGGPHSPFEPGDSQRAVTYIYDGPPGPRVLNVFIERRGLKHSNGCARPPRPKSLTMSTDLNIEALLKRNNSFVRASSVEFNSQIHKRVTSCLELEHKGVPFVLRGVPLDVDPESPFDSSTEWLKRLSSMGGKFSLEFEWN